VSTKKLTPPIGLPKLNPELKAKWIEALRSDRYKQARTALHKIKGGGFCCLGVLCDVIDSTSWEKKAAEGVFTWRDSDWYPPESVLPRETSRYFARLNDDERRTFKTIANAVEKYL
jgi:hypothetical protein